MPKYKKILKTLKHSDDKISIKDLQSILDTSLRYLPDDIRLAIFGDIPKENKIQEEYTIDRWKGGFRSKTFKINKNAVDFRNEYENIVEKGGDAEIGPLVEESVIEIAKILDELEDENKGLLLRSSYMTHRRGRVYGHLDFFHNVVDEASIAFLEILKVLYLKEKNEKDESRGEKFARAVIGGLIARGYKIVAPLIGDQKKTHDYQLIVYKRKGLSILR